MGSDHIAIDYESYYSPQVSVKKMGVREYLDHPDCEIYLVSAYGPGLDVACHPDEFNWEILNNATVVSHNANFDWQVFLHLQEQSRISREIKPAEWNCSANLSAYLGVPRSLDGAAKALLNREVSKDVRHDMRGRRWSSLTPAQRARLLAYSHQDAEVAHLIWEKNIDRWPPIERAISLLTLETCAYGIALDIGLLYRQLDQLETQKLEALKQIPWYPNKPPLSRPAFDKACEVEGLTPPVSLAMSSEECDAWMELFGGAYPWVGAMRDFRRANMLAAKIHRMIIRIRANGRMPYELKYFGAHTGRDSGSGKINMQNFPREPICGIDLRASIIAPKGKKLIIADLKQIEARILLYIVKDSVQLALISAGMSPYESHARASMGWKGQNLKENDPRRYILAKARVLALGYGAGWRKFHCMAYLPAYLGKHAKEVFSAPVTEEQVAGFVDYLSKYEKDKVTIGKWNARDVQLQTEWTNAWLIVTDFRARNQLIVALWKHLHSRLRDHVGDSYRIRLPSGRELQYRDVMINDTDDVTGVICQQGKWIRRKLYGGLLTENLVSAIARDVLRDAAIRLKSYGFKIIMRVHDELVIEALLRAPVFLIEKLMKQSPSWLPGCPIDSSVEEHMRYKK
jgi:DNA polymerase bacteriophage-type